MNINYLYLNSVDISLMISLFYLVLFYILNLNGVIKAKHVYMLNIVIIPLLLLFLFLQLSLTTIYTLDIGLHFKYFKTVFIHDYATVFFKKVFFVFLFFFLLLTKKYFLKIKPVKAIEFSLILVFFCLFSSMVISSYDLGFAFICLEGMSLSTYVLIAYPFDKISIESSIKYMWFSICSAVFMILGISFLFILTKDLSFFSLGNLTLEIYKSPNYTTTMLLWLGVLLVVMSFLIKLAAFPVHAWSLDVYEGSWSPVTVILMFFVKLVFIFFFTRFLCVFIIAYNIWYKLLLISTLGCFFYGSIGAFRQTVIKRILAYTSLVQTGFFFLGFLSGSLQGVSSSIFHMFGYLLSLMLFFSLMFFYNNELIYSSDLVGLSKANPIFSIGMSIVFLSMCGIPPLLGFFTKFFILVSLYNSNHYLLLFFSIIISILVSFVYLRFVKIIWFESNIQETKSITYNSGIDVIVYLFIFFMILFLINFIFNPYIYLNVLTRVTCCFFVIW